jgi:uncharacterized protein with PIN domain
VSSNLKQHKKFTFFIDRSLGKKAVASALIDAGHNVIIHDDIFAQNTPDEDWLKEAGKKGWIILSKDNRIRYRANEVSALESANALAFILIAANVTGEEMAAIFIKASKRMIALAGESKRPAIFTLGRDGKPKKI